MFVSELVETAQVLPPINISFWDLSVENPLPVRVIRVPDPGGPPGPDLGETEESSGVLELSYWNEHWLLRQLLITPLTSTTALKKIWKNSYNKIRTVDLQLILNVKNPRYFDILSQSSSIQPHDCNK